MLVYDSTTGNCRVLALSIDPNAKYVKKLTINEPCLLITHTTGRGAAPKLTLKFLKEHYHLVKGVVVSGEIRYKKWYCLTADIIQKKYPDVPILLRIEKQGSDTDKNWITDWYQEHILK